MNLAGLSLKVDAPAEMEITHPVTGLPMRSADGSVTATVKIYSVDSPAAKQHQRASIDRRLGKKSGQVTAEAIEAEQVDYLVSLVAGWTLVDFDGNTLDLDSKPETVRAVLSEPGMAWLRSQIDSFAGERANFMPTSKKG